MPFSEVAAVKREINTRNMGKPEEEEEKIVFVFSSLSALSAVTRRLHVV